MILYYFDKNELYIFKSDMELKQLTHVIIIVFDLPQH